jgi:hypothetical protein
MYLAMDSNELEPSLQRLITPRSDILGVRFIAEETGEELQIQDIRQPDEGDVIRTGWLHKYDRFGHFLDMARVKLPEKFHEKQEVVLEYADDHKTGLEVGAVAAVATIAVASLIAYRRKHRS